MNKKSHFIWIHLTLQMKMREKETEQLELNSRDTIFSWEPENNLNNRGFCSTLYEWEDKFSFLSKQVSFHEVYFNCSLKWRDSSNKKGEILPITAAVSFQNYPF